MNKNVLLINSGAQKGNTYGILLKIESLLKEREFYTDIINLFDYKAESCLSSQKCVAYGSCRIDVSVWKAVRAGH